MLQHPMRGLARGLFRGDDINGSDFSSACRKVASAGTSFDLVASGVVGAAEGTAERFSQRRSGPFLIGRETSASMAKKLDAYLKLVGVQQPASPEIEALVQHVVARARANRDAGAFPTFDEMVEIGKPLLGLNGGDDRVVELVVAEPKLDPKMFEAKADQAKDDPAKNETAKRLSAAETMYSINAFDRRGFHVLGIEVGPAPQPGVLYVWMLSAAHGRNCEDFRGGFEGARIPGRGNHALVAAGLESMIVNGAEHGLVAIAAHAGSPSVARLYQKMGFAEEGTKFHKRPLKWALEQIPLLAKSFDAAALVKSRASKPLVLDLTDERAVRQAITCFRKSRARDRDVPKNVTERMIARGDEAPVPSRDEWLETVGKACGKLVHVCG
jgi:hypothetical protein